MFDAAGGLEQTLTWFKMASLTARSLKFSEFDFISTFTMVCFLTSFSKESNITHFCLFCQINHVEDDINRKKSCT